MHPNPVSISLSSYGADYVRQRGQEQFLDLLAAAGVTRVELREELFTCAPDTAALSAAIAALRLECLYSTPLELWTAQGVPDPQLAQKLDTARALGAVALKVSLGHYHAGCDVAALATLLPAHGPLLLVENDQTLEGGTPAPLAACLEDAAAADCPLAMTFDIGNWHWTGSDPLAAARRLGHFVRYLHCKGVALDAERPRARVPDDAELAAWEALLACFPADLPRAIEYPLEAPDPVALTAAQLSRLRRL